MNTRLTSATVILTLMLGLGLITDGWYSIYISVVVVLALTFSAALRAFLAFRNPGAARALFGADELEVGPTPAPAAGPPVPTASGR